MAHSFDFTINNPEVLKKLAVPAPYSIKKNLDFRSKLLIINCDVDMPDLNIIAAGLILNGKKVVLNSIAVSGELSGNLSGTAKEVTVNDGIAALGNVDLPKAKVCCKHFTCRKDAGIKSLSAQSVMLKDARIDEVNCTGELKISGMSSQENINRIGVDSIGKFRAEEEARCVVFKMGEGEINEAFISGNAQVAFEAMSVKRIWLNSGNTYAAFNGGEAPEINNNSTKRGVKIKISGCRTGYISKMDGVEIQNEKIINNVPAQIRRDALKRAHDASGEQSNSLPDNVKLNDTPVCTMRGCVGDRQTKKGKRDMPVFGGK